MDEQEILYSIALTRINYFSLAGMLELYRRLGSATAVMEHRKDIREVVPDASLRLAEAFKDVSEPMRRAEAELQWDRANGVVPICMLDDRYPQRLKECADAPLLLFYKGTADLNQARVIDIVGTRHCTLYGVDIIRRFCADLKQLCPQVLIVSGLAYGVDVNAHRQALQNGFPTVGVLAHGLDDLYPRQHRQIADEMAENGGLLTEFLTCTNADKMNFVRRNRIVAGVSDATILVESGPKGGGLITCGIAQSYGRDVFAFPGPVGSEFSKGCNNLIRDNGAALISNAEDFVKAMGWETEQHLSEARQQGIERELFPNLSEDEQKIVHALSRQNDLQVNILTLKTGIPVPRLSALLFSLEMKGVVKTFAGGMYHLLN
ncbi:DNA-protecting protein DprA [Prevotella sp. oral taxon 376]|uniref:DNA-processing protein DprA n=1 Tax=Prevotella sp. oral taxon 376 TaxID=712466 RepID=UPI000D1DD1A8|nr:DNA-processing protein DprA [Prevotella sp. oral taxon 376]PTL33605.1 DNA-protecting protein DprA [Prevotella sp. oral taxon 376]